MQIEKLIHIFICCYKEIGFTMTTENIFTRNPWVPNSQYASVGLLVKYIHRRKYQLQISDQYYNEIDNLGCTYNYSVYSVFYRNV